MSAEKATGEEEDEEEEEEDEEEGKDSAEVNHKTTHRGSGIRRPHQIGVLEYSSVCHMPI